MSQKCQDGNSGTLGRQRAAKVSLLRSLARSTRRPTSPLAAAPDRRMILGGGLHQPPGNVEAPNAPCCSPITLPGPTIPLLTGLSLGQQPCFASADAASNPDRNASPASRIPPRAAAPAQGQAGNVEHQR